ncbi:hypothetical protein M407DRAFT_8238 [Tulasnella calospora MUT 4182]|uniref:Amine oxidase domain-containing protein n=1 Tax=Tulasnella calospora MUT 4182 TaxID=1051891 RepID=A0A0C3LWN3_9AGAM|nr:hypothetical protein M407DRAFT_8238 [Tulasnella calospora MUT 4182]
MVGDDAKLQNSPPVKVAIIGSGLAGLSAAYYLSKENQKRLHGAEGPLFEVHLFEKAATLGMDSASISVPLKDGKLVRVDVPMRSFQEAYYSNLVKLYREIGVGFRAAHFNYSFSTIRDSIKSAATTTTTTTTTTDRPRLETTLLYNGRGGLKGVSRPASPSDNSGCFCGTLPLLTQLATFAISTFFLLLNYLRLLVLSVPHRVWAPSQTERLDEWTRRTTPRSWISRRLGLDVRWSRFIGEVVVPLFSCVCTVAMEDVWAMPVEAILDYIYLGLFTPNYVASQGVQDVVARLAAALNPSHIHLSSTITSITPDPSNPSQASIHFTRSGASKEVNHTDDSLAPSSTSDRRILNFICSESRSPLTTSSICVPPNYAMATHVVFSSPSTRTPPQAIYQTTNPIFPPSSSSIISVTRMERAILTVSSKLALDDLFCDTTENAADWTKRGPTWGQLGLKQRKRKQLGPLQGVSITRQDSTVNGASEGPRIWVCGSYAFEGIPLLEGCVASARLVVQEGIAGNVSAHL